MEVLSPLKLGPERFAGYDHHRFAVAEPWYSHSFDHSLRFGPRPPPSPPEEMPTPRISLPSIADILNPPKEEGRSTERRSSGNDVQRRESHDIKSSPNKVPAYQPPASHLPPTPPLGADSVRQHDLQPLPTLQPQHVSRLPASSFGPETRHLRAEYSARNDSKPVLNTNVASFPSPTQNSAPPNSALTQFPRGQKRRSEAPHTRRSRSPPAFSPRGRLSDPPTSLPPASSVLMGRSPSLEFSSQLPPASAHRPHTAEYPPPLTASSSSTMTHASLPPQRSGLMDYPAHSHSRSHSHSQSLSQPYSPQSSPSSTKTSIYDPRMRSMSWQQHHRPQLQHHDPRHPTSPYGSAPPSLPVPHPNTAVDRYICSTCGKCFSRPSSLRIHSHSHTGEKPFRCSREGCGKAFSVRSNMKRHEKGCHVGIGIVVGPGYLGNPGGLGVPPPGPGQHIGLGVGGLPSMAAAMSGARELAPAMDGV